MIVQKDIGKFKISVHGVNLMKALKAIKYLSQECECLGLIQLTFGLAILFQVSSVTKLGGNEYTVV